jgi:hypothetical protein
MTASAAAYSDEFIQELPRGYKFTLLKRVEAVTVADCKKMVDKYLLGLFDPKTSDIVCVSGPTVLDDIAKSFESEHFKTETKSLEDFQKS